MRAKLKKISERYLIGNAGKVLRHAWSVWLLVLATTLSGAAIAVPFLAPVIPNEWVVAYAAVVFVIVTAALLARFIAQKELGGSIGDQ